MLIRTLKAAMVGAIGAWAFLIALGNVIDYDSNWRFVQHVLAMDTVFADNLLTYRAVTNPVLQALGYGLIIATECVMSALCLVGAWRLVAARNYHARFVAAKSLAAAGLVLVFLLYFVGFVAIGGEWFCSWQSAVWNGQTKAVSFLTCAMFVLVILLMHEEGASSYVR